MDKPLSDEEENRSTMIYFSYIISFFTIIGLFIAILLLAIPKSDFINLPFKIYNPINNFSPNKIYLP